MRKISMKRKSRTPNSETSDVKEDDKSGDEASPVEKEDSPEPENESPKKTKKTKRASKSEENGTDKKSKKSKEPAEDEDEEEQYEVEAVLNDRMIRGARQFFIKWKGYDDEHNTWEPESTLSCPDLIADYFAKTDKEDVPKGKRGRQPKSKKKTKNDDDDEEETEGDYEVDKILEVYHKRSGKREFLVHWKGYSTTDNSWEPEENMNCPELIERFMAKVAKAKSSDSRELRVHRMPTERFTLSMTQSGRKLSKRNLGKQRVQYHDNE